MDCHARKVNLIRSTAASCVAIALTACDRQIQKEPTGESGQDSYILAVERREGFLRGDYTERTECTSTVVVVPFQVGSSKLLRELKWSFPAEDQMEMQIVQDSWTGESIRTKPVGATARFHLELGIWKPELPLSGEFSKEDRLWIEALAYNHSRGYDRAVYGYSPRRIGETWSTNDPAAFFNGPADDVSGNMSITFKGFEAFEGHRCASLAVDFDFRGQPKGETVVVRMFGHMEVLRSMEHFMDLQNIAHVTTEVQSVAGKVEIAPVHPMGEIFHTTRRPRH